MRLSTRPFVFLAACGLALACSACSSNNEGKIVGKWKIASPPSGKSSADFDSMSKMGMLIYIEFKTDNTFEFGIGADKPEMLEIIKQSAPGKKTSWPGKYKLKSGESVEMYDLPKELQTQGGGLFGKSDKAVVKIKIDGDNMAMTDADGTTKLTRLK